MVVRRSTALQIAADEALARALAREELDEAGAVEPSAEPPVETAAAPAAKASFGQATPRLVAPKSRSSSAPPRPLPPTASSTGKKYYVLKKEHNRGIAVVAGATKTLSIIGSWEHGGRWLPGFETFEEAGNRCTELQRKAGDSSDSLTVIFDDGSE